LWPAAIGLVAGVLLFLFASLPTRDPIWVGWRAGQIMLVSLPALVARTAAWLYDAAPRVTVVVWVAAAMIGLPTTAIDAVNAQDVANRNMGAAFRLTVIVTRAEQDALTWIRMVTSPTAVVQVDAAARGQDTWTLIPTFAERRMYAGLPISLLAEPEYRNRAAAVVAAFDTPDSADAYRLLKAGGVDYLYVGDAERRAHSAEALAKFDRDPGRFQRVFANAAATIYELR
jgi:4-amino-4-deoxy-L-arabinose transferase-like glycosyltransferase